jgi:predicted NAD-dependent protein-ADP-ribosyltransferase YbiA (DUF1768 family)
VLVRLRKELIVLTAEETEASAFVDWLSGHVGQVFRLREIKGGSATLHAIGPEDEACRVPLNITSSAPLPLRLISNFAHAPFVLDGQDYASIEGFWQGLKFPAEADRRRLASLYGGKARDEGFYAPASETFTYAGERVLVGTWSHWQLMERACMAKFAQNSAARDALLSTVNRPLVHQVRRDSRTIPGAIMSEIWTRVREKLLRDARRGHSPHAP